MNKNKLLIAATLFGSLSLMGCPTDPPVESDAGRDAGGDGGTLPVDANVDAGPVTLDCATYCGLVTDHCTGEYTQYENNADCLAFCADAGWAPGTGLPDDMGPTLGCHIYHAGTPADGAPEVHCAHAGPEGGGVCGSADFRTETTGYSRVDRMGMPAIATALVSSGMKNAYNDGNPSAAAGGDQEVVGTLPRWAPEFAQSLINIHLALNDDLAGLSLDFCGEMTPRNLPDGLPDIIQCATQPIVMDGPTVLSLVVPDTLTVDTTMPSGFPNGRRLADPVIDATLAIVLLDMTAHTPTTFVTYDRDAAGPIPPGLNPTMNDVAEGVFLTTFPYVHPAHEAP